MFCLCVWGGLIKHFVLYSISLQERKEIEQGNTMYCVGGVMAMVCMCVTFYFVLGSLCLFLYLLSYY